MNKKILITIIIILVIAIIFPLLSYGMYHIDLNLIENNKNPIFIIRKDILNDGGTTVFYGIWYQIIKWHKMEGKNKYFEKVESHFWIDFNDMKK